MTEITWQELKDMKACIGAMHKFREIFGKKASIKDVVKELKTRRHFLYRAWEAWLLAQNLVLTEAMIENGANVGVADNYALYTAAIYNRPEVVELLIKNGADIQDAISFWARSYKNVRGAVRVLEQYLYSEVVEPRCIVF